MKTIYECSQSKSVKWMTAIFILVMILSILAEIYFVSQGMDVTSAIIISAILLAVLFSCFFVAPMYIITDAEGIGIRTLVRTKRISYEDIDHIERFDDQHRLFINKGKVGKAYVTDANKVFLIYRTKGKPIAISVSEPDEFMPYYLKGGAQ